MQTNKIEDIKSGRIVEEDGSVRPSGDTGFRFTELTPPPYVAPAPSMSEVFPEQFHNDEVSDLGPALNAVRFVKVDYDAVVVRNLGYIRENIAREKLYQEKLTQAAHAG